MKKTFVLVVLFVLPIVAYLFFASGVNNFGRLPTLTENILDINSLDPAESFKEKITILGFLGKDIANKKGNAFNLNQKIYKRFYEFRDFQMIMAMPKGTETGVEELKKELSGFTDISKWHFVFLEDQQIKNLFDGLKTDLELQQDLSTPYVFIVDKKGNLRGRKQDEDEGLKYGFNTSSVADLNNKMEDDVKIILAEYRLALKENNGLQQ